MEWPGGHSILIGMIVGAAVSAASVIFAFARPARRFIRETLRLKSVYADRLAAGIVLTAFGTVLIGSAVLWRVLAHTRLTGLYIGGWAVITLGYFFHFTAWFAAQTDPRDRWPMVFWFLVLVVICIVIAGIAPAG